MAALESYNELARALHHARWHEALRLVDAMLVAQPASGSLQRQRQVCLTGITNDSARARAANLMVAPQAPLELIRVDAGLFDLDQQLYCNAPLADLHALGFTRLLDAASTAFSRHGDAPTLIRFLADEGCATLIICFAARMRARTVRLLACVSEFTDGGHVLTHRDDELALASTARVDVLALARTATLTELVARHAGRVASRLRLTAQADALPLASLADCDRIWRLIAGT